MTDPIADMLTRIRNATLVKREMVEMPASKIKCEIARILKEEGYIRDFTFIEDDKQGVLRLFLKYGTKREQVVSGLRRISRPGLRVYASHDKVPRVLGGLGVAILSTSKGLMTDKDARNARVGGEVMCYIW
jgi:small subunit ribosomal protein S8